MAEIYPIIPETSETIHSVDNEIELTDIYNSVDTVFEGFMGGALPDHDSSDTTWVRVNEGTLEVQRDMLSAGRGRYTATISQRSGGVYEISLASLTPLAQGGLLGLRLDF
jgi:hypothetical protein